MRGKSAAFGQKKQSFLNGWLSENRTPKRGETALGGSIVIFADCSINVRDAWNKVFALFKLELGGECLWPPTSV